jgi:ferredoxin
MSQPPDTRSLRERKASRREFLKRSPTGLATLALAPGKVQALDFESFFQKHFRQLSRSEIDDLLQRLEEKYSTAYDEPVHVSAAGPIDGVVFGYGLEVARCIGCRRCVYACVEENNQSRDPQIQWIRVLEFERERVTRSFDLEDGNPYYDPESVPEPGKIYLPVSCQQGRYLGARGAAVHLDGEGRARSRPGRSAPCLALVLLEWTRSHAMRWISRWRRVGLATAIASACSGLWAASPARAAAIPRSKGRARASAATGTRTSW